MGEIHSTLVISKHYLDMSLEAPLSGLGTLTRGTLVTKGSGPNITPRLKWRTREDVAEAEN